MKNIKPFKFVQLGSEEEERMHEVEHVSAMEKFISHQEAVKSEATVRSGERFRPGIIPANEDSAEPEALAEEEVQQAQEPKEEHIEEQQDEEASPPPPLVISDEDLQLKLQIERDQAYAQGLADGKAQAMEENGDRQRKKQEEIEHLLRAISSECALIHDRAQDYRKNLEEQAVQLSLSVARKLAGDALKDDPAAHIRAAISEALEIIFNQSEIKIILHPDVREEIEALLEKHSSDENYAGKITYHTRDDIPIHDCRIEWWNGGIEHQDAALWKEVRDLSLSPLGSGLEGGA